MDAEIVEEEREREMRRPHAWGDLRTWVLLGILIAGAIFHTFFIRAIVGQGVMQPEQWNLGKPPTGPN